MNTESPKPRLTSGLLIKAALALIVLYFAIREVGSNWDEALAYDWRINWPLLIASLAAHLAPLVIFAWVWRQIIAGFGYRDLTTAQAFKISYLANLGRYIPGKVWQVFGMVYLARQAGIKEQSAVASWALTQMFAIPAAFFVCALAVWLQPAALGEIFNANLGAPAYAFIALLVAFSILLVIRPQRMLALFNWTLRLIKREPVNFEISVGLAAKIFVGYALGWASFGAAFWLFVNALTGADTIPFITGAGVFVLAYQVGYLAFFSPGGIGVRELVLVAVLQPLIGPVAAGLAVAARLWNILAEILASLIALPLGLQNSPDK